MGPNNIKPLGVALDCGFSLSDHFTHCIHRSIGRLRLLYKYKSSCPDNVNLLFLISGLRKQHHDVAHPGSTKT